MEKINNSEYKNKQKWPKDVYVCDFYSKQLAEIETYLLYILITLGLILSAILFK